MASEQKFNRSQFSGTSVSKLDEKEQELKSKIPQQADSGRADYHSIESGKNYFRVYPAFPNDDTYVFPKTVHWLPQEVEVTDDKGKKKKTIKRKPVFNAKVHGDLPFDLVDEYTRIATRLVKTTILDEKDQNDKLWPIISWKDGIGAQTSWVMYADKHSDTKNNKETQITFGRLEVWDNIYKDMKKQAAALDDDSDAVSDPFSDPDNGKLLIITKESVTKGKKTIQEYTTGIFFQRDFTLSDEKLNRLLEHDSLSKQLVNCYKRSDFEKAVDGLRIIDEDHNLGVFDDPEFIDLLDQMDELVPQEEDKEDEEEEPKKKEVKKSSTPIVRTPPTKKSGDEFDAMDRKQLKAYITKMSLSIKVFTSTTEDQIRTSIREELAVLKAKEDVEEEELEEEEEELESEDLQETEVKKDDTFLGDMERIKNGEEVKDTEDEEEIDQKLDKYNKKKSDKKK